MDHGTDRDVALSILQAVETMGTMVTAINANLFVPHIVTQPESVEVAVGESATATFTAVVNNYTVLQWQYKNQPSGSTWYNSTASGATTASLTVEVTAESRYNSRYRLKIIGKDGTTIYTDTVQVLQPAPAET